MERGLEDGSLFEDRKKSRGSEEKKPVYYCIPHQQTGKHQKEFKRLKEISLIEIENVEIIYHNLLFYVIVKAFCCVS